MEEETKVAVPESTEESMETETKTKTKTKTTEPEPKSPLSPLLISIFVLGLVFLFIAIAAIVVSALAIPEVGNVDFGTKAVTISDVASAGPIVLSTPPNTVPPSNLQPTVSATKVLFINQPYLRLDIPGNVNFASGQPTLIDWSNSEYMEQLGPPEAISISGSNIYLQPGGFSITVNLWVTSSPVTTGATIYLSIYSADNPNVPIGTNSVLVSTPQRAILSATGQARIFSGGSPNRIYAIVTKQNETSTGVIQHGSLIVSQTS